MNFKKNLNFIFSMLVLANMATMPSLAVDTELKRLDPHGDFDTPLESPSARKEACTVCHETKKGRWVLKAGSSKSCFNCHSSAPHSGILEHAKHKVSCVDCHSPHRAGSKASKEANSLLRPQDMLGDLPTHLIVRHSARPLLRKTCTECHSWKKIDP